MKKLDFKKAGMQVVSTGVGAIAAKVLNKPLVNMNPKIRGILKIAAGALLPFVSKSEFVQGLGNGIVAVGTVELVAELMPNLAGIGDSDPIMTDVGFIDQSNVVSGSDYDARVYGDDEIFGSDDELSGIGANDVITTI